MAECVWISAEYFWMCLNQCLIFLNVSESVLNISESWLNVSESRLNISESFLNISESHLNFSELHLNVSESLLIPSESQGCLSESMLKRSEFMLKRPKSSKDSEKAIYKRIQTNSDMFQQIFRRWFRQFQTWNFHEGLLVAYTTLLEISCGVLYDLVLCPVNIFDHMGELNMSHHKQWRVWGYLNFIWLVMTYTLKDTIKLAV